MKTDIKTIASFIAAAVWADAEYNEAEKEAVKEIAEALEFKEDEFVKCVDGEIARIKKYSAEKATEYIVEAAEKVEKVIETNFKFRLCLYKICNHQHDKLML